MVRLASGTTLKCYTNVTLVLVCECWTLRVLLPSKSRIVEQFVTVCAMCALRREQTVCKTHVDLSRR